VSITEDQKREIEALAGGRSNVSSLRTSGSVVNVTVKDQGLVDQVAARSLEGAREVSLASGTLRIAFADNRKGNEMGKYHDFAADVLENVGGKENVNSVTHCITRLRFKLKDEKRADGEALKDLDGVIQIIQSGGQYQVVVGDKVDEVYDELVKGFGLAGAGEVPADDEPAERDGNLFNRLMDVISGSMGPLLMGLAAAGMIKGIVALCASLGWMATTDGAYQVLYAIGDGYFYFLPIILGYTAAKKFGLNEFTGIALGAALVYPTMVNIANPAVVSGAVVTPAALGTVFAGTPFAMSYYSTFFGLPIIMPAAGYTSSVIPIILAVWVASKLERWLKTVIPSILRNFLVPVICFAVMAPLTYLVIGPVAGIISSLLTLCFESLYNIPMIGAPLTGLVVGGLWSTLVMFGLHWAAVPVILNNMSTLGFDYVSTVVCIGGFVGVGQGIAVLLRTKSDKLRGVTVPALISQLCGIGEPFLYGVQIPSKFLFYQNIAFSAIGGLACGLLGIKIYMMGGMGFFVFPSYINPATGDMTDMIKIAAVVAVLMIAAFAFTFATYRDKNNPAVKDVDE
jgi:PTS system beta-glucosides-specific IIC component